MSKLLIPKKFPKYKKFTFAAMEEKKLHIIKNVGLLYLKFGIRNVTMDQVANEFGISKKTLYQYFKDKEDLVSQVVDHFLSNPEMNISNPEAGNAIDDMFYIRERVAQVLKLYNNNVEIELKRTYPHLYEKVYETKRQRIFDNTIENMKKGMDEGLYRKDLEPTFIAKLQLGRTLYTMNPDYDIFEEYELHSLAFFDNIMDYHMNAVCTAKGLEYYKKRLKIVQNEN